MAHNLFGSRFLGRQEPAWHKLGEVFTDPISVSDAVLQAGLGYEVHLENLYVGDDYTPIPSHKAIVRQPTDDDPQRQVFGLASNSYKIIQNTELGKILDPLAKTWPVETVGALGKGETMFLSLDAGEHTIKTETSI